MKIHSGKNTSCDQQRIYSIIINNNVSQIQPTQGHVVILLLIIIINDDVI